MAISLLRWQTIKVMNRDKEIKQTAKEYAENYGYFNVDLDDVEIGFMEGAEWADKHPSSSLISKVWNLALKTAAAQMIDKMDEFKSEKEIVEYIMKHLKS